MIEQDRIEQHTPTPWQYVGKGSIEDANGEPLLLIKLAVGNFEEAAQARAEQEEYIALLVTAVNAYEHDQLVIATLKEALEQSAGDSYHVAMRDHSEQSAKMQPAWKRWTDAQTAIALAEGKVQP